MNDNKSFIDTNVLLYLLSADAVKSNTVEGLLKENAVISVQVLNEITNVTRRKLQMPWTEVTEFLNIIQSLCEVVPISIQTHQLGLLLAQRYQLSLYDAIIVASALLENCKTLFSQDMHHQQVVEKRMRIINPFVIENG